MIELDYAGYPKFYVHDCPACNERRAVIYLCDNCWIKFIGDLNIPRFKLFAKCTFGQNYELAEKVVRMWIDGGFDNDDSAKLLAK